MEQKDKYITVTEALSLLNGHGINITRPTLIKHASRLGILYRFGKDKHARIFILKKRWKELIHGTKNQSA